MLCTGPGLSLKADRRIIVKVHAIKIQECRAIAKRQVPVEDWVGLRAISQWLVSFCILLPADACLDIGGVRPICCTALLCLSVVRQIDRRSLRSDCYLGGFGAQSRADIRIAFDLRLCG